MPKSRILNVVVKHNKAVLQIWFLLVFVIYIALYSYLKCEWSSILLSVIRIFQESRPSSLLSALKIATHTKTHAPFLAECFFWPKLVSPVLFVWQIDTTPHFSFEQQNATVQKALSLSVIRPCPPDPRRIGRSPPPQSRPLHHTPKNTKKQKQMHLWSDAVIYCNGHEFVFRRKSRRGSLDGLWTCDLWQLHT